MERITTTQIALKQSSPHEAKPSSLSCCLKFATLKGLQELANTEHDQNVWVWVVSLSGDLGGTLGQAISVALS
eukprot:1159628-Pelagomonas_calceolata.AAC.2